MNLSKILEVLKLVGPYLLEILKVILNMKAVHTAAVDGLKEKGLIRNSKG